mgnify:CR=1 FL=1
MESKVEKLVYKVKDITLAKWGRKEIKLAEENGWKFIYLGANQDSFQQGSQIGIPRESSMDYDATDEGIYTAFSQMTTQIISYSQDIIQDIILTE